MIRNSSCDLLDANGNGVVRDSSHTVITSNGNEATFQNGGEQNFIQTAGLTTGLVKVVFGTNVTVLPRYDSNTRLVLESKENMRRRGVASPDEWDAVALTFAEPVAGGSANFHRRLVYSHAGIV